MKEVIIVRHAKSDWGNETLRDVDRHLNERGYNDAYSTSEWYVENHGVPHRIISSTATRALNTALIFARAMNFRMEDFRLEKKLYEANLEAILSIIREQKEGRSLMIFGHNPGFTNISNELSEEMFFDNIPTCGIVSLTFETDSWKAVAAHKGKLRYYKFPKDFKNRD
jgi:phosphohistidine phosphatase